MQERINRGNGQRRKVVPSVCVPRNCPSFLRVDVNKTELFSLLGKEVVLIDDGEKLVYATYITEKM